MKIVCLGDSITAGAGVPPEDCWVAILGKETPDAWINAGIVGDTCLGMLVRLQTQILPQKPDAVFLLGGINDILLTGSADTAKSSTMAMVHQCAHAGVRPILGIPYGIDRIPNYLESICQGQSAIHSVRDYSVWLRALSAALHLRALDFGAAFEGAANSFDPLLSDGLHPSSAGHRVMAEAVKRSGLFGR